MSDIVERLRIPVMHHSNAEQTNAERREAADEIGRLRAALQRIVDYNDSIVCSKIARDALTGGKE